MKTSITILIFLLLTQLHAQVPKVIHANERQAVAIFFPNQIRQAVVGSPDFTFSYNKENPQHVGLLQGIKGVRSNLLVITNTDEVFSYSLHYKKELDTLNYFVMSYERVGLEKPMVMIYPKIDSSKPIDTIISPTIQTKQSYREEYFKRFSNYHLNHNKNKLKRKRKKGVVLKLNDLIYDRTEVYALIEIKNKSGIDFEMDYLKMFKVNGTKRRKSSFQKLVLSPIYMYDLPKIIKAGERRDFVLTFPKVTFGDKEKLLLELKEKRGNRILQLINN